MSAIPATGVTTSNCHTISTRFRSARALPSIRPTADPTNGNKTLPDILLRTVYPGFNTINSYNHLGHTNYHALTSFLQQRVSNGLVFGLAYTFSKALGTTSYNPVVPNNEAWNYGRQGFDRRQNLQASWSYDFPNMGKKYNSKLLGALVDRWTISGIFSMQSGAPFNPAVQHRRNDAGLHWYS